MDAASTTSPDGSRPPRGGRMAAAVSLTVYSLLLAALVAIIYQEDKAVNWGLMAIAVAGLVVVAMLLTVRSPWVTWVAVGMTVVDLIGDVPHQLPDVLHPQAAGRAVAAAVIILVGVLTLALTVRAALSSRRPTTEALR